MKKLKKLTQKEQIAILQEELVRKDKIIEDLRIEKELLFKLSIRQADKLREK